MKLTEQDKKALRDGLTIQFNGTSEEFKKFSALCDEYTIGKELVMYPLRIIWSKESQFFYRKF